MKGIRHLIRENNLNGMEVYRQMQRDCVPFNYDERGANWTNFITGKVRPKDPAVYIYFSLLFDTTLEYIISLYSESQVMVSPSVGMEELTGRVMSPGRPKKS